MPVARYRPRSLPSALPRSSTVLTTILTRPARPALAAEAVRYLNHAAPRGGVTVPATVATVTADLSAAAYRLPQLLAGLGDWLTAEAAAGRVGDDHRRPPLTSSP